MNSKENATLIYPLKNGQVLLGLKQRKVSVGKFTGYGGKFKNKIDNDIHDTCIRELFEETGNGLECNRSDLKPQAIIDFTLHSPSGDSFYMKVFIYTISIFSGEYSDNLEMVDHTWFTPNDEMYSKMLPDNEYFLPKVFKGDFFVGSISSKNGNVTEYAFKDISKKELYEMFK